MSDHSQDLEEIVLGTEWLRRALDLVRDVGPPCAYIAAGAIRELVWNSLTGKSTNTPSADVDVIYFDAKETRDRSAHYQARLKAADPSKDWEVTNQAFVHLWLAAGRESRASPFASLVDGVRSWPEIATAVAVCIQPNGKVETLAPCGLEDLFNLIVRPNSFGPDSNAYSNRVSEKGWAHRWSELQIEPVRSARRPAVSAERP